MQTQHPFKTWLKSQKLSVDNIKEHFTFKTNQGFSKIFNGVYSPNPITIDTMATLISGEKKGVNFNNACGEIIKFHASILANRNNSEDL